MVKLLGALLILTVSFCLALTWVGFEKKRLKVLEGWLELLVDIRGRIDCYLMPLDEILASSDCELLRFFGETDAAPSLSALFLASRPYLSRESERLLNALLRELGGGYREEQLKRCDFYLDALRKQQEQLFAALPSRLKAGIAICVCSAIGITLLLW